MLHYVERGNGPALVFLHAFPLDHTMWEGQLAFFSKSHRVIAPDTFGFGASQPPRPWTMSDMGAALLELLNALTIAKCTLVGLSMGGYLAIPFTLMHPARVTRLVLAHTRARADLDTERANRNAMIAALQNEGIESLPPRMVPRLLGAGAAEGLRRKMTEEILTASAEASIHAVTAMRDRADQVASLRNIACPTLVIAGTEDVIITVGDCEKLAAAVEDGELAVIPGVGHMSNLEAPATFNLALESFIRRTGSE